MAQETTQASAAPNPDIDAYVSNQEKEVLTDEAKLQQMEQDLSDFEAKVDEAFIPYFLENTSDEDKEMLEIGDDLEAKVRLILALRTKFVDEVIEKERGKVEEFRNALNAKKEDLARNKANAEFHKKHPEVDMQALGEFIQNDLTPRQQQELLKASDGDIVKFLELALELFEAKNGKKGKKEEADEFPPDLDGEGGAAGEPNKPEVDDEEYKKKALGLGRGF